ncbi:MAG: HlyD family efflux transporter periplasmic adaptor subunit [Deltaproteobacteria bacterium]|nr:HlyD family efflux transporter periplasmic adaptor subunit [Deltaproteobacteria bacterium]
MKVRTLLPLVAVLVGCQAPEPSNEVPTLEVTRTASFVRHVTAEGYLRAVEATPLTAPAESRRPMKVAWVAVDGIQVAEGDIVVRFDASEMQRKLEDSEDDVTSAQRQIAKERAMGEATQRKRERTADLAGIEMEMAQSLQTDDERILSRNEIIETRIDADLAQAKADHARSVKKVEGAVSRSQVDVHDIARRHAQSEVERAKDGLQQLEVSAPHEGILVLERDWQGNPMRVGDSVWRGQKLAEIPLVTTMEAELFVLEADAGDLAEGLPAELVVEAHPNRVYKAKVARVDTLAKPRHQEVPVQYFEVTLSLESTDEATMKVGQRVRATIILEQPDAIVVPRQAVFERDNKRFVYRKDGSTFEEVEVEIGSSSAGRVVVLEGLSEGDHIALRDPSRAADELIGADSGAQAQPEPGKAGPVP